MLTYPTKLVLTGLAVLGVIAMTCVAFASRPSIVERHTIKVLSLRSARAWLAWLAEFLAAAWEWLQTLWQGARFLFVLLALCGVARGQFVTGPQAAALRAMIPVAEYRDDPRVLIYTEQSHPKVYQFNFGPSPFANFNLASYNISANDAEPLGNPNLEFPWNKPGGTDRCRGVKSFKFLRLPDGLPIVWFNEPKPLPVGDAGRAMGYGWLYPIGTVVGEVLTMISPSGRDVPFEARIRTRIDDGWEPDIFRPFPATQQLAAALKIVRPDWESRADIAGLVRHLESDVHLVRHPIFDNHPRRAFQATASLDYLPAIDHETVDRLMSDFEFDSALEQTWRGEDCFAPTTEAAYHIVPRHYDGTFLGTSRESCTRCHETVGMNAKEAFQPDRDWYGLVRGDDQVMSFSPVDVRTASGDGFPRPSRMLEIPGVIERFSVARHTPEHYRRIK